MLVLKYQLEGIFFLLILNSCQLSPPFFSNLFLTC